MMMENDVTCVTQDRTLLLLQSIARLGDAGLSVKVIGDQFDAACMELDLGLATEATSPPTSQTFVWRGTR